MKTVKIIAIFTALTLVLGLIIVILTNKPDTDALIKASFAKIEKECDLMTISEIELAENLIDETECIQDNLIALSYELDPEEIAVVAFSLYGDPNYPVLTRNCHPAIHVLGTAKAVLKDKTFTNNTENLHGCSGGFLHGYSEYPMSLLEGDDFIKNGFNVCVSQVEGLEHSYNCSHTYGHYLYRKIDKKTGPEETGNLTKKCENLEKIYVEGCVWGIFMDYFSHQENYLQLTNNRSNIDTKHILRPCFTTDNKDTQKWCIMMSWEVLYKAAQEEGGSSEEIYERFQKKCQQLEEEYHFYCGMTLSFPITRQHADSVDVAVDECVKAGHGNEVITSGCLMWGGRLLWRHYRDFDYFKIMCLDERNTKRGSCFDPKMSPSSVPSA
jgi:hypothetical protein